VIGGLVASICALAVAAGGGLAWKARNGQVSAVNTAQPASVPGLTQSDIGAVLGSRATLVQFSSAFCAPCRATRQLLRDVAGTVDGVAHVEIDAESRLDLVRRLDVRRTPTTLVLAPDGTITHRASGQPSKADVISALGAMLWFPIETMGIS
jgi:thiol-disulfide isomerase/thioredoxin